MIDNNRSVMRYLEYGKVTRFFFTGKKMKAKLIPFSKHERTKGWAHKKWNRCLFCGSLELEFEELVARLSVMNDYIKYHCCRACAAAGKPVKKGKESEQWYYDLPVSFKEHKQYGLDKVKGSWYCLNALHRTVLYLKGKYKWEKEQERRRENRHQYTNPERTDGKKTKRSRNRS